MLLINCYNCGDELVEQGGLLFSPPKNGIINKYHFCVCCFEEIIPGMPYEYRQ